MVQGGCCSGNTRGDSPDDHTNPKRKRRFEGCRGRLQGVADFGTTARATAGCGSGAGKSGTTSLVQEEPLIHLGQPVGLPAPSLRPWPVRGASPRTPGRPRAAR